MANRMSSVWPEMPFMRGPKGAERLREWLAMHREIHARAAARRERVLTHDWARARLCHILSARDPEVWTGFLPPARDCLGRAEEQGPRTALIALLHDVEAAEAAEREGMR